MYVFHSDFSPGLHISTEVSLGLVATSLTSGVLLSLLKKSDSETTEWEADDELATRHWLFYYVIIITSVDQHLMKSELKYVFLFE